MPIKKNITPFAVSILFLMAGIVTHLEAAFISPTKKQLEIFPSEDIKKAHELRKMPAIKQSTITSIAVAEKQGFLGYHGDNLDFLIYQDIIRHVLELIVEIPIRKDFHFMAPPLDPALKIQSKGKLTEVFLNAKNPTLTLQESTFPLNFSIWDNANRVGFNTLENYAKNESTTSLSYKKRLKWFFENLCIEDNEIDDLFELSHTHLKSASGVILQFFDTSSTPYDFAKEIAYPAFPTGFISDNVTVDEYFMDENFTPPFPYEIRLLLTNHQTLNPKSPFKIIRYHPDISSSRLKKYESALKEKIRTLSYNVIARNKYQSELQNCWNKK